MVAGDGADKLTPEFQPSEKARVLAIDRGQLAQLLIEVDRYVKRRTHFAEKRLGLAEAVIAALPVCGNGFGCSCTAPATWSNYASASAYQYRCEAHVPETTLPNGGKEIHPHWYELPYAHALRLWLDAREDDERRDERSGP